jgi:hypothetical protein
MLHIRPEYSQQRQHATERISGQIDSVPGLSRVTESRLTASALRAVGNPSNDRRR